MLKKSGAEDRFTWNFTVPPPPLPPETKFSLTARSADRFAGMVRNSDVFGHLMEMLA